MNEYLLIIIKLDQIVRKIMEKAEEKEAAKKIINNFYSSLKKN
jgi:hypothetical protein